MARQKPKAVFFEHVAQMVEQARRFVGRTADLTMCVTYFEIGRMIVEKEQGGRIKAEYGKGLIPELSAYLSKRIGSGFSERNLRNARKFYEVYAPAIWQSMSAKLESDTKNPIWQSMTAKLGNKPPKRIPQTMFTELGDEPTKPIPQAMLAESEEKGLAVKSQTLSGFSEKTDLPAKSQSLISQLYPFRLSWTHYVLLTQIKNEQERSFYEIEAANQQWTVRQLQRQYSSSLYERLALSRNKNEVMRLAVEGQTIEKPQDLLKEPFVLEFLGMEEKAEFSESDLESAIISKFFINYFDRHVKTKAEKPTIGILLCKQKNDSIVELTLPKRSNIYASEYSLYLPDKGLLQRKLTEWAEEFEEERRMKNRIRR